MFVKKSRLKDFRFKQAKQEFLCTDWGNELDVSTWKDGHPISSVRMNRKIATRAQEWFAQWLAKNEPEEQGGI